MKIVVKRVGQLPEVREIENELHALQEIVGGDIEPFRVFNGVLCICNGDGKYLGLKPNFIYLSDVICGDVFFCSVDRDDFASLNEKQIDQIMHLMTITEKARRK